MINIRPISHPKSVFKYYIYIYIYSIISRMTSRLGAPQPATEYATPAKHPNTVGFHNFNLRIFNLRVSNPDKLIVDVFLTRCRIPMCQGLGPKKHDEISEIDRTPNLPSEIRFL